MFIEVCTRSGAPVLVNLDNVCTVSSRVDDCGNDVLVFKFEAGYELYAVMDMCGLKDVLQVVSCAKVAAKEPKKKK